MTPASESLDEAVESGTTLGDGSLDAGLERAIAPAAGVTALPSHLILGRSTSTTLSPDCPTMLRNLVPGGYLFTHIVFWTVVAMVAVGTNTVAVILSVGLVMLLLETAGKA